MRADETKTGLEAALDETVRCWVAEDWPFEGVVYPGRGLDWEEWDALPDRE